MRSTFAFAKPLFVLALVASATVAGATTPGTPSIVASIDSGGKVCLHQPKALEDRLVVSEEQKEAQAAEKEEKASAQRAAGTGFRVEVFADNNVRTAKSKATAVKSMMMKRFGTQGVYLVFDAPFWRVRVGNYTTRAAAESAASDIRRAYPHLSPDVRIVRSKTR